MKLKTLEDFGTKDVAGYKGKVYTEEELRQEAIKLHNTDCLEMAKYLGVKEIDYNELNVIMLFIRKFANLTEEDLQ